MVKQKQYTIPIFIPHKGCKNECVFCNQRKISGEIVPITPNEVDKIIESSLKKFNNAGYKIQIAFFGGSFTGLSINEQNSYLDVAEKYIDNGSIDSIRLSTRPDYITDDILRNLKRYKIDTIELGVQSMNDTILSLSKRGHTSKDVINACNLINKYKIRLGIQMMIGLPGSNIEDEMYSIGKILKLHPKDLRIYPVYVIYPSELYDMYVNGSYIPLTLKEAIYRTARVVKICMSYKVRIIRLGLQSTDQITQSNKQIVGPVCDNLAEYVYASLILDKIDKKLKFRKKLDGKIIYIKTDNRYASMVVGPNKVNKKYLEDKYNIKLKIKGDKN